VVPADYFSRGAEEALLLAMLEGEPRDIMLLTGPPSSGKTATIARVLQRREERKDAHKVTGSVVLPSCFGFMQWS
jgi:Cdc6-like AAA superfamily ATPase